MCTINTTARRSQIRNSWNNNNLLLITISMWEVRFSQQWILRLWCSGIWHRVVWYWLTKLRNIISQKTTILLLSTFLVTGALSLGWNCGKQMKTFRKELKMNKLHRTLCTFNFNDSVTDCTILPECSILSVPRNFSRGRGVIPSLAERGQS
jgi:hypothetical protein